MLVDSWKKTAYGESRDANDWMDVSDSPGVAQLQDSALRKFLSSAILQQVFIIDVCMLRLQALQCVHVCDAFVHATIAGWVVQVCMSPMCRIRRADTEDAALLPVNVRLLLCPPVMSLQGNAWG